MPHAASRPYPRDCRERSISGYRRRRVPSVSLLKRLMQRFCLVLAPPRRRPYRVDRTAVMQDKHAFASDMATLKRDLNVLAFDRRAAGRMDVQKPPKMLMISITLTYPDGHRRPMR
jgi:hypothetical protein